MAQGKTNDDDDTFTDEMHFREEVLTAKERMRIIPKDAVPTGHEGMMIKRTDTTMELDDSLAKSISQLDDLKAILDGDSLSKENQENIKRHAFREGELLTMQKVIDVVTTTEQKRAKEGFKELNFTIGVLNYLLFAYVFGVYPQHFWLLFLLESLYFLPKKFINMTKQKPLSGAFYYLDFCWMMNFSGVFVLIGLCVTAIVESPVSDEVRKQIYLIVAGIALGPLLGAATILPFVAVLFHDVNTMTNLFIHLFPPMVAYTFLWHADEIVAAWPGVFSLNYLDCTDFFPEDGMLFLPGSGIGSVSGNAVAFYLCWFIPYVSWMLLIGLDIPRSDRKAPDGTFIIPKYDTVFHSWMRGGVCITMGRVLWKRPKEASIKQMEANHFEARDFLVYMTAHFVAATGSIFILGFPSHSSQTVHSVFLMIVTAICVHRGARRYTYYSTHMFSRTLKKQFASIIVDGDSVKPLSK